MVKITLNLSDEDFDKDVDIPHQLMILEGILPSIIVAPKNISW